MHELYIAESILKSVLDVLPPGVLPDRVIRVDLQVGQLDAIVTESLLFLFDAIKESNGLPNAALNIETIQVLCRCSDCSHQFPLDLPIFICPECSSSKVEVLRGRGITIQRIEAKDE
jgi:hydrogenase nickel incorporation protein HypA/HybF